MNNNLLRVCARSGLAALCLALTACASLSPAPAPVATVPPPSAPETQYVMDDTPLRAMLAFYSSNARHPAEHERDYSASADPYLQMQQAIRFGQMRPPELQKALAVLERVQGSRHPTAVSLSSLARLLQDEYTERLRLDQQLRSANRRVDDLQEKIEALSAIEASLPTRSMPKALRGKQQ